jgi:hypothetical protein
MHARTAARSGTKLKCSEPGGRAICGQDLRRIGSAAFTGLWMQVFRSNKLREKCCVTIPDLTFRRIRYGSKRDQRTAFRRGRCAMRLGVVLNPVGSP